MQSMVLLKEKITMEVEKWKDNIYQVQFYTNLRVGWIKKEDEVGYVLNPFNFTYYGSEKGNMMANQIIEALTEEFENMPLTYETLIEADKWVQQNQQKFV